MDGVIIGWIGRIFRGVVGTMGDVGGTYVSIKSAKEGWAQVLAGASLKRVRYPGTYVSIKSAKGPMERAFIKKAKVIAWIRVLVFLGLFLTLPKPYNFLLLILYGIVMLIGIHKLRKKHTQIRQSESGDETFVSKIFI